MIGRIDNTGKVRCGKCDHVLGADLNGSINIVCHHHGCETYNTFNTLGSSLLKHRVDKTEYKEYPVGIEAKGS
ncbi:hypothetical protein LCGC14_0386010 [marine sediment metagenome]|uniref:Uncharacterized protein n=1 Tax=marine sediment metagenome TaxID=412755 RepID=A0A0F9TJ03_9ZZZZ